MVTSDGIVTLNQTIKGVSMDSIRLADFLACDSITFAEARNVRDSGKSLIMAVEDAVNKRLSSGRKPLAIRVGLEAHIIEVLASNDCFTIEAIEEMMALLKPKCD